MYRTKPIAGWIIAVKLAVIAILAQGSAIAQDAYDIRITVKPYKNEYVYLGYHYGKLKALADSVLLDDNSSGRFRGAEKLAGGIYFVVSPSKQILFEVLIDADQQFEILADTNRLQEGVKFTGSAENESFQSYGHFANITGQQISQLNAQARAGGDGAQALNGRIQDLSRRMQVYRDSIINHAPGSFLTALLRAMREPQVPPASQHPGGKYDSAFAFNYYKSNFWNGVNFQDDRLVRTPFFEQKLEKYYRDLVMPNPDSIRREVDHMLLSSRGTKEMFKYLMVHFVQKYINPEYMGQDAVFVHLFEKYINAGQATFFTDKYRDHINKRAYSLMANLIGKPAAEMQMVDSAQRPKSLYSVKGDFTVVVFWDPTCGHCKEVVPKVDSIFQAKWKDNGVQVYGVKVDGPNQEWTKFIRDNKLSDWVHVYQLPSQEKADADAGRPGFRQLYDVYQTPVIYLLDREKRILAKKLTYLQVDEVMEQKKNKLN